MYMKRGTAMFERLFNLNIKLTTGKSALLRIVNTTKVGKVWQVKLK